MPKIKFWVNGIETLDYSEAPLSDAERAEVERKEELARWTKLVEKAAAAAAVLSAFLGVFVGDKNLRHRCDLIAVALGGIAIAVRFIADRR
jgi:hypothetical protein